MYVSELDKLVNPVFSEEEIGKRFCVFGESAKKLSTILMKRIESDAFWEHEDQVRALLDDFFGTDKSLWYIGETRNIDIPFDIFVESEVGKVKRECPDIWPPAMPAVEVRYEEASPNLREMGVAGELAM